MLLPHTQTWFVIFIRTLMDVIRMLLMKCVTDDVLCWITTIFVCMSRVGWNPSWFLDYRDFGSLSIGIWSLRWLFLYLRSYDLVGSVTSVFIPFHQKCFFKSWYIFEPPGWIQYLESWASDGISSRRAGSEGTQILSLNQVVPFHLHGGWSCSLVSSDHGVIRSLHKFS